MITRTKAEEQHDLRRIKAMVRAITRRSNAEDRNGDLFSAACVGYTIALQLFDPSHAVGADFWTFAFLRIRGAIYDEMSRAAKHAEYVQLAVDGRLTDSESTDKFLGNSVCERPNESADTSTTPIDESLAWTDVAEGLQSIIQKWKGSRHKQRRQFGVILGAAADGRSLQHAAAELGASMPWVSRRLTEAKACAAKALSR
jgi:RNA polymerase sigma factor (sigma-70 family)